MRIIIITNGHETWEMPFDSTVTTDSRALHMLLAYVDPGEEYTVKFTNKKES